MQAISENESKHRENKQPINVKEAKVQAQPCGLIKTRSGVRSERWVKKKRIRRPRLWGEHWGPPKGGEEGEEEGLDLGVRERRVWD
jgi:hypothetical protein